MTVHSYWELMSFPISSSKLHPLSQSDYFPCIMQSYQGAAGDRQSGGPGAASVCLVWKQESVAPGAVLAEDSRSEPAPQMHTTNTRCAGKEAPPAASQCPYTLGTEVPAPCSSC